MNYATNWPIELEIKSSLNMLKFKRPRRPNGFKQKSKTLLDKLGSPKSKSWPIFKESFWQAQKKYFMKAQYQKCGYCEIQISDNGDVEHYRPKSVVQELLDEGTELDHLRNIRGRKMPSITQHGYWWLAYEWTNYLLACSICNQKYKSALFPISKIRKVRSDTKFKVHDPKKIDISSEKPLLINPFEKDLEPFDHFEFGRTGLIKPRLNSPRARETIKVCGLHRISLTLIRAIKASTISQNSLEFLAAAPKSSLQKMLAVNLFFDGHEINSFPGMTRIIFTQETGLKWLELEALLIKENWMKYVDERVTIATELMVN